MLKRFLVGMMSVVLLFCMTAAAESSTVNNNDFKITDTGEITAYYGDELAVIPEKVDGIPVVKIGERAFFDLGISSVYLPEGLSVIGKSAFEGSSIGSADIPSEVSIIGERAFANCSELLTVFACFDENTLIGEDAFCGTNHLIFYINCNVNSDKLNTNLRKAKGDDNYEIFARHIDVDYDEQGNVLCNACGYTEQYMPEILPFDDVPHDAWYYDSVLIAYMNDIIKGKSETKFDPDATMTCAEAAKIAACINSIYFEPIPEYTYGPWYQPYVDYCYNYGLLEDYVIFDWDKPITRGQMAYLFSHCDPWEIDINDVPITDIGDVYDTTPYAYEILDLYNKGIAVGDENMYFYPDSAIKRCEAAAIIARITDWDMRVELPKG